MMDILHTKEDAANPEINPSSSVRTLRHFPGSTMGRSVAWIAAVFGGIGLLVSQAPGVTGHVYLAAPVSRNFYYTTAFQTW